MAFKKTNTNYMEHSPFLKADSCCVGHEIPVLWCHMVCYHLYQTLQLNVILSQLNTVQSHTPFLKIHFNITIPSFPTSRKWSLLFMFSG